MSRHEHPSERLSSGLVGDFAEALALVRAQFAAEAAIMRRDGAEPDEYAAMDVSHDQIATALLHAGRVYQQEQERARLRTVERLREDVHAAEAALDDEAARWLELLAASLEDGDYGRLAI